MGPASRSTFGRLGTTCFTSPSTASSSCERQTICFGKGSSVPSSQTTCSPFDTRQRRGPARSPVTEISSTSESPEAGQTGRIARFAVSHRPCNWPPTAVRRRQCHDDAKSHPRSSSGRGPQRVVNLSRRVATRQAKPVSFRVAVEIAADAPRRRAISRRNRLHFGPGRAWPGGETMNDSSRRHATYIVVTAYARRQPEHAALVTAQATRLRRQHAPCDLPDPGLRASRSRRVQRRRGAAGSSRHLSGLAHPMRPSVSVTSNDIADVIPMGMRRTTGRSCHDEG